MIWLRRAVGGGAILAVVLVLLSLHLFRVRSVSMMPTLQVGQYILLDRWISHAERGDLIVFNKGESRWIKRLVGLPGDSLIIQEEGIRVGGVLFPHHPALSDPVGNAEFRNRYRSALFMKCGEEGDTRESIIPEKCLFVIGDNYPESSDSREFGLLPRSRVVGRVIWY